MKLTLESTSSSCTERVARLSRHLTIARSNTEFITLEEGANMKKGTRVTLAPGFPALFAEALKNLCYVKGINIIRVKYPNMGVDKTNGEDRQQRLFELTAQKSLPVLWHDEEKPRSSWIEQLYVVERVGAPGTPKLIPEDPSLRAEMFGICALILAEGSGLLWEFRLLADTPLARKYGYEHRENPDLKIKAIVDHLMNRLEKQNQAGSRFLVGKTLTAADIYFATMSFCIVPPSERHIPRTGNAKMIDLMFGNQPDSCGIAKWKDKIAEFQEFILTTYCESPAVL